MKYFRSAMHFATAFALVLASSTAYSASVLVQVTDAIGHPLVDTVIYAEPISGQAVPKATRPAEIEQKARKFEPLVSVIQAGTEVSFPNNDTVRHHVYSFSQPKIFDIKLYSGVPGSPVLFDKPGTVVVGCNIHDQMVAYIHVVPTPYFAKTDGSGKVTLNGLVPGNYKLKAWYYTAPGGAVVPEQALAVAGADVTKTFRLNAKNGAPAS